MSGSRPRDSAATAAHTAVRAEWARVRTVRSGAGSGQPQPAPQAVRKIRVKPAATCGFDPFAPGFAEGGRGAGLRRGRSVVEMTVPALARE
ncbi:hypothetical protein GCM10027440_51260 [Nocardiopsis coralliicola]